MKRLPFFLPLLAALALAGCKPKATPAATATTEEPCEVAFSADSAYAHIVRQCQFGPRTPGSKAHDLCADYIRETFRSSGLTVTEQTTTQRTWDGASYLCRNICAAWNPAAAERLLICTHYDSRPWADADADSSLHHTPVMAANDGASGVGVLLELARILNDVNPSVGVDLVCFDLEDYGTPYWATSPADGTDWCVGSRAYAASLAKADVKPRYGVLLDMVGGDDARFRFEYYSMRYAQDVVGKVWYAAQVAGAAALFQSGEGPAVTDDHLPLNQIAGVPTIDIIPDTGNGFSRTWHTTADTPENISTNTLKAVGQTLVQLLCHESLSAGPQP